MSYVLCFGEALIDFVAVSRDAPGEPPLFAQHPGGAPANVAVAVARLGRRAEFAGGVSEDAFGDFLCRRLREAGVGTRWVKRSAARTALAFVGLDAGGERSFSFYRDGTADLCFRDGDFEAEAFDDAHAFHACSNTLTDVACARATFAGLARARAAGVLVSFDLNLRAALWPRETDPRPRLWQALAEADLIKLSGEELAYLVASEGGLEPVLAALWRSRAQLVLVTHGADGVEWFTPQARGRVAALGVATRDTTGAGDAFIGAFLVQLLERHVGAEQLAGFAADAAALEPVLRFACACGALATTRPGAFGAMPARSELETSTLQTYLRGQA